MIRHFFNSPQERSQNSEKLEVIKKEVLSKVPGASVASDQFTRLMDLAIDFCEDVKPLSKEDVNKIVSIFEKYGATAKVSSIHVNGWFGDYDKISMIKTFCEREFGESFDQLKSSSLFVGDSPNDEPSFKHFSYSVGVANISHFLDKLEHQPTWITESPGGSGFCEVCDQLC
jgi:hypothetical protein